MPRTRECVMPNNGSNTVTTSDTKREENIEYTLSCHLELFLEGVVGPNQLIESLTNFFDTQYERLGRMPINDDDPEYLHEPGHHDSNPIETDEHGVQV